MITYLSLDPGKGSVKLRKNLQLYDSDIGYDISNKKENRTEPEDIAYSLYLYFLGLSLRIPPKLYPDLLKEVILPSETGFKGTNQRCQVPER